MNPLLTRRHNPTHEQLQLAQLERGQGGGQGNEQRMELETQSAHSVHRKQNLTFQCLVRQLLVLIRDAQVRKGNTSAAVPPLPAAALCVVRYPRFGG